MNILNQTYTPKRYNKHSDDVLSVNSFTVFPTTEIFDFIQFLYHGDRVWTVITYAIDTKSGLYLTRGQLVEDIVKYHESTNSKKKLTVDVDIFSDQIVVDNLRIKTMATMVIADDSELRQAIADNKRIIKFNNNDVFVYDARESDLRFLYTKIIGVNNEGDYIDQLRESIKHTIPENRQTYEALVKNTYTQLYHREDYIFNTYMKGNIRNR